MSSEVAGRILVYRFLVHCPGEVTYLYSIVLLLSIWYLSVDKRRSMLSKNLFLGKQVFL